MIHVALSIPDAEIGWAESRVAAGKASSIDAYFADLARRDREQAEEMAWLQAEIDKGLASGVDPRSLDEIFDEIEAEFFDRCSPGRFRDRGHGERARDRPVR